MFLATTALHEFWDTNGPILFLGSWCRRYNQRSFWQKLDAQVLPNPWDDRDRFYAACAYLDERYEYLLRELGNRLNSLHGVDLNPKCWRIVVGPWLVRYLHVVYDRYIHLKRALDQFPNVHSILLDPRSYQTPYDTLHSAGLYIEDAYNLQIFSQLLLLMGFSFPTRALDTPVSGSQNLGAVSARGTMLNDLARRAYGFSLAAAQRLCYLRRQILLCDMYWPEAQVWKLAISTGFKAIPFMSQKFMPESSAPCEFIAARESLGSIPATDEFERLFVRTLPSNFPRLYLECFGAARAETLRRFPSNVSVIVSAAGWKFNEFFKFMAAEASQRGCRLFTAQHGGGYGVYRYVQAEHEESLIGDSYAVWGWSNDASGRKRNLPNPTLSSLAVSQSRPSVSPCKDRILFIATLHPQYLYAFQSTPVGPQWEEYIDWEMRFLSTLPGSLRSTITFRPYWQDYGFSLRDRMKEGYPDLLWDNSAKPIWQKLSVQELVVIDHLSTVALQALVANVPTILFWNPLRWETRPEASAAFDNLRKAGVLCDTPEAAASKLVEVCKNPRLWWQGSEIQAARQTFVDRYALARKNWLACWKEALYEELEKTRKFSPTHRPLG